MSIPIFPLSLSFPATYSKFLRKIPILSNIKKETLSLYIIFINYLLFKLPIV